MWFVNSRGLNKISEEKKEGREESEGRRKGGGMRILSISQRLSPRIGTIIKRKLIKFLLPFLSLRNDKLPARFIFFLTVSLFFFHVSVPSALFISVYLMMIQLTSSFLHALKLLNF